MVTGSESEFLRNEGSAQDECFRKESRNNLKEIWKSKDFTVARVLTGLCVQMLGMMLEGKHQDLVNSSTLKLDDEDLLENENYAADFSTHYKTVAELSLWADNFKVEISKVVTMHSCNGIMGESILREKNLLLESVLISNESRKIIDAANQGL